MLASSSREHWASKDLFTVVVHPVQCMKFQPVLTVYPLLYHELPEAEQSSSVCFYYLFLFLSFCLLGFIICLRYQQMIDTSENELLNPAQVSGSVPMKSIFNSSSVFNCLTGTIRYFSHKRKPIQVNHLSATDWFKDYRFSKVVREAVQLYSGQLQQSSA